MGLGGGMTISFYICYRSWIRWVLTEGGSHPRVHDSEGHWLEGVVLKSKTPIVEATRSLREQNLWPLLYHDTLNAEKLSGDGPVFTLVLLHSTELWGIQMDLTRQ